MMGTLLTQLGNKSAGQLIRHDDWNTLVAAVDSLVDTLVPRVTNLEQGQSALSQQQQKFAEQLGKLDQNLADLGEVVASVQSDVKLWVDNYVTLNLSTSEATYPVGIRAELEARIADVRGNPVSFTTAQTLPWVDFVASWGLLLPAPGFIGRGGVGERTLSVQVNQAGVAKVLLRAEHGEGISDEEEKQISTVLSGKVPGTNIDMRSAILNAATPVEAFDRGTFRLMATEYDRKDASTMRRYVDSAFLKYSPQVHRQILIRPLVGWRDHRSTVMAFVKADGDPTTVDHSRGVSSIQVVFRDWVNPFIELEYFQKLDDHVIDIGKDIRASIGKEFAPSLENVKQQIKRRITDQGWVGRLRNMRAVTRALDQVQIDSEPAFLPLIKQSLRDAVNMQQTLDSIQLSSADAGREVALDAFSNSSLRADQDSADMRTRVSQVESQFGQVKEEFQGVKALEKEVIQYDARGLVSQLRADFDRANREVEELKIKVVKLDVSRDIGRLTVDVGNLSQNLKGFEDGINLVKERVTKLDTQTKQFQTSAEDLKTRQQNVEGQVGNLTRINVKEVTEGLGQLGSLANRLEVLERR